MKKIVIFIVTLVMAFSAAMPVYAEQDSYEISAYSAYSGDYAHSVYSAQRTCPDCHQKTLMVTCNGERKLLSESPIQCSGIYGHPSDCLIKNRQQSTSSGRCYNCYDSSIIVDTSTGEHQGEVLVYDTHIDYAYHTGTGINQGFWTCLY